MAVWLTVVVVLIVAVMTAALRSVRLRRRSAPRVTEERRDTAPMDVGATIRSYVIPDRWLRSPPGAARRRSGDSDRARYASASLERTTERGAPASWQLLRGRTRIGRDSDNHIVLDDERVSLHHALVTVRDGVYWLEDLGSTNGTFIGEDKRVMTPHPLEDGEELRLGGVVLKFRGVAGS